MNRSAPRREVVGTGFGRGRISIVLALVAFACLSGNGIAQPRVSVRAEANASESGTPGRFEISRNGNGRETLLVAYMLSGTAVYPNDFTLGGPALPGTIEIPAGESSIILTVLAVDDDVDEDVETILVTLSPDPSYQIDADSAAAVLTIVDNDEPSALDEIGIAISGAATGEGASTVALSVALDSPAPDPVEGTWQVDFTPDAGVPGNQGRDHQVVLSTRSFSVRAGERESASPLIVTLGTVAGTVSIMAEVDDEVVAEHRIDVEPGPPRVTSAEVVPRADGFDVVVFGFSLRMDVATSRFVFAGPGIEQPAPINVATHFEDWFEDPESFDDGTMFEYRQPFMVDGDASAVDSVTITLIGSNGMGSAPVSVPFP